MIPTKNSFCYKKSAFPDLTACNFAVAKYNTGLRIANECKLLVPQLFLLRTK